MSCGIWWTYGLDNIGYEPLLCTHLSRKVDMGLKDAPSRVMAFRLEAAQKLLCDSGHCWLETAELLLRKAGRLSSKQVFFCVTLVKPT